MSKLIGKAEKIENGKRIFLPCYIIADHNERWHNIWKEVLYDLHHGIVVIDFARNSDELLKLIKKIYFDVAICDLLEYKEEYLKAKRKKESLEKIVWRYNKEVAEPVKNSHKNSLFIFSSTARGLFGRVHSDYNILKPTNRKESGIVKKLKENRKLVKLSKNLSKEKMDAYFSSLYDGYFEDEKWFYDNYSKLSEKYPPGTYLVIRYKKVLKHFSSKKELDKFLNRKGWTTKDALVRRLDDLID